MFRRKAPPTTLSISKDDSRQAVSPKASTSSVLSSSSRLKQQQDEKHHQNQPRTRPQSATIPSSPPITPKTGKNGKIEQNGTKNNELTQEDTNRLKRIPRNIRRPGTAIMGSTGLTGSGNSSHETSPTTSPNNSKSNNSNNNSNSSNTSNSSSGGDTTSKSFNKTKTTIVNEITPSTPTGSSMFNFPLWDKKKKKSNLSSSPPKSITLSSSGETVTEPENGFDQSVGPTVPRRLNSKRKDELLLRKSQDGGAVTTTESTSLLPAVLHVSISPKVSGSSPSSLGFGAMNDTSPLDKKGHYVATTALSSPSNSSTSCAATSTSTNTTG